MQLIILVCLIAAVIELDNTGVGQIGFSRPIVCGTLFGFLMGNAPLGLQLGICMELLFLDYTPVGGVLAPNGTVGALCAVMTASLGAQIYMAFFFGVVMGLFYRFVEMQLRVVTGKILMKKQDSLLKNPLKAMNAIINGSLFAQFAVNFVFMFTAVCAARAVLNYGIPLSHPLHLAFQAAYMAVPWMGMFVMFRKFTFVVRR